MTSERIQRQIDRLLDEADEASTRQEWDTVRARAEAALAFDPANSDARAYLDAAARGGGSASSQVSPAPASAPAPQPTAFVGGRYQVKRFLGEGGKKKVYLAHDATLDRDVAFALIKTEGLDEAARTRVTREAQAMGRLGDHPNIVTVYDVGEEAAQPYMVLPLLPGGDIEGAIEKAENRRLPMERVIEIGDAVCRGLEFAHAKGIVHRDLKPGNVWLAADGTAKIGDFGLAVAADKSRLTHAGVMVGTVSYMPPEQALGGEVGPRSDLYSLGCMLYEMVCGRPPFVGDESVAIIGQHLNTPPVAPTWHRPDCPPGLEVLILRLLEKDASKRPASAAEVREALASVHVGATLAVALGPGAVASPAPTAASDPLYRRVFVGREQEQKQLQTAFDAALSGQGSLAMVVGEPGIGKTALCEQLATYVTLRGGKSLVGHCYEEGSLSLPYLPFIEAMRSYVLAREPDGLQADLGTGAADVARIVSEVRDRVAVELRSAGDPEDDRWRLMQAVSAFLRSAASVHPLLLVLEDLHDADRGTLDMLQHVSRNLDGARLLIVGTYRDVEVDRAHPLSGALAELRRAANFSRVPLRGLTVDEVNRMYTAIRGQEVSWAQAEAVHRQTEGNPLFIQEVLRYLVEEGLVVRQDGRYVPQGEPGTGIPEGLRDVIGKRLSRLSEKANEILSIAAVIGRDFRLDVLQNVAQLSEEEVDAALEEAADRALVEVRPAIGTLGFRFTHAFFRQTLYEETFASRRLRLHQQVARALEEVYGQRVGEHAAELAEHYAQSTNQADLRKALQFSELAADRARVVFAHGDEVRHLEQALKVQEVLDPDDHSKRCDLLVAFADALNSAGMPRRVLDEVAPSAFALAIAEDDNTRASAICTTALKALLYFGALAIWTTAEATLWTDRADQYAADGTLDRVHADIAVARVATSGEARFDSVALRKARLRLTEALDVARSLNDALAEEEIAQAWISTVRAPQFAAERLAIVQDANVSRHGPYLLWAVSIYFEAGLRREADAEIDAYRARALQIQTPYAEMLLIATDVIYATLDGRLEEAESLVEHLQARGDELGLSPLASAIRRGNLLQASRYLGNVERLPGLDTRMYVTRLAEPIPEDEARALIDKIVDARLDEDPRDDEIPVFVDMLMMEGAVRLRHERAAQIVLRRYRDCEMVTSGNGLYIGPLSIARVVGNAAAILDEAEESRRYYDKAMQDMERIGHRPELALSHLAQAELLLEHFPAERPAAIEHLDIAIAEFRDMKMQPSLERALGHRELLKA